MLSNTDIDPREAGSLCSKINGCASSEQRCQPTKEMLMNANNPSNAGRRRFVALAGAGVGAAALCNALPRVALADELPHQTLDDPTAKALNYTEDASKAPAPHQAGQNCANCNFFHGGATGFGPCDLFPGKAVNAGGWCTGYAKKP
jgi:hypothetical protein